LGPSWVTVSGATLNFNTLGALKGVYDVSIKLFITTNSSLYDINSFVVFID
jgi:hypothetical protein